MSGCASDNAVAPTPTITVAIGDSVKIEGGKQCHVGAAGIDADGTAVAVTSGHCSVEGAPVTVDRDSSVTRIGQVAYIDYPLDFAVIKLYKSVQLAYNEVTGHGRIDPTQPGCISAAAGAGEGVCGQLFQPRPGSLYATADYCSLPGDSGMPVVQQGTLVGINGGTVATPGDDENPCSYRAQRPHDAAYFYPIKAILDSMNSHGSPGARMGMP